MENVLRLISQFFQAYRANVLSLTSELVKEMAAWLRTFFSLRGWTISIAPPLPVFVFEAIQLAGVFLDFLTNSLSLAPFLAIASVILDEFRPSKKLRQRVMTLDDAAKLVAKVIVDNGIKTYASPLPSEWQLFEVTERISKIEDLIKAPTPKRAWRFIFGSIWGRVVRLLLLLFSVAKMIGLVVCLWNWTKLVSDKGQWPRLFTAALSQDAEREWQRTDIYRRIGGVAP